MMLSGFALVIHVLLGILAIAAVIFFIWAAHKMVSLLTDIRDTLRSQSHSPLDRRK